MAGARLALALAIALSQAWGPQGASGAKHHHPHGERVVVLQPSPPAHDQHFQQVNAEYQQHDPKISGRASSAGDGVEGGDGVPQDVLRQMRVAPSIEQPHLQKLDRGIKGHLYPQHIERSSSGEHCGSGDWRAWCVCVVVCVCVCVCRSVCVCVCVLPARL